MLKKMATPATEIKLGSKCLLVYLGLANPKDEWDDFKRSLQKVKLAVLKEKINTVEKFPKSTITKAKEVMKDKKWTSEGFKRVSPFIDNLS